MTLKGFNKKLVIKHNGFDIYINLDGFDERGIGKERAILTIKAVMYKDGLSLSTTQVTDVVGTLGLIQYDDINKEIIEEFKDAQIIQN
jgi:hypothetical protein